MRTNVVLMLIEAISRHVYCIYIIRYACIKLQVRDAHLGVDHFVVIVFGIVAAFVRFACMLEHT